MLGNGCQRCSFHCSVCGCGVVRHTYEQFHGKVNETKVDFRVFDFPSFNFIPLMHLSTQKNPLVSKMQKRHFPRIFDQMARAAMFTNVEKVKKSVHFPCLFWLFPRYYCLYCVFPARRASPFTHNG